MGGQRVRERRAEREVRYSRYRLQGLRGRKEGAGDRQGRRVRRPTTGERNRRCKGGPAWKQGGSESRNQQLGFRLVCSGFRH